MIVCARMDDGRADKYQLKAKLATAYCSLCGTALRVHWPTVQRSIETSTPLVCVDCEPTSSYPPGKGTS